MNFNDIKTRIERIYLSINERLDFDVVANAKITQEKTETWWMKVHLSFRGENQEEDNRIILAIIHNLASLKDHLKKQFTDKGLQSQIVEDIISKTDALKLIIDLDNADKHGYPVRDKRSLRDPQIINVKRWIGISPGVNQGNFYLNHTGNEFTYENCVIYINADIVDKENVYICSLDELINDWLSMWNEILNTYLK